MIRKTSGTFSKFGGFRRDAKRMIAAGLIDNLGFALNGFVLVLYLDVLGFSSVIFGTLSLVMEVSNVVVLPASGFLADRYGRKRVMLLGTSLGTLGIMIFAFFQDLPLFILAAVLLGASSGFWGPSFSALLSEKTTAKRRKYLFSLNAIAGHTGSGVITLVGGFIPLLFISEFGFASQSAYRMIFMLAFLLKLLGVAIVLRVRTDRPRKVSLDVNGRPERKPWGMILKFAIPSALTGLGAGILVPYFPLYFKLRFELDIDAIGIFFATLSFVMAIMTIYLPRLAERRGTVYTTTYFHILAILAMISIPFTPWLGIVVFLFVTRAALMNVPSPVMTSFMMGQLPHSARATAQSSTGFAWMITHAAGVFAGGFIWDTGNLVMPFYISTVLYVLSTLAYFMFFYRLDDGTESGGLIWPVIRGLIRR